MWYIKGQKCDDLINRYLSNISRTEFLSSGHSRLVLQVSLPNPLKPGAKSKMKM